MKPLTFAAVIAAAISLAACSQPAAAPPAAPASSPVSTVGTTAPAVPATAAGARAAATAYFDLYAAGQYAATWALLSPAAQQVVTRSTWVKVHEDCTSSSAPGLSYVIGRITLAGNIAVVKVSLAGALSKLGSEEQSFTYSAGRWGFAPSDLSAYKGHTVAQAVAALKAMQLCG